MHATIYLHDDVRIGIYTLMPPQPMCSMHATADLHGYLRVGIVGMCHQHTPQGPLPSLDTLNRFQHFSLSAVWHGADCLWKMPELIIYCNQTATRH